MSDIEGVENQNEPQNESAATDESEVAQKSFADEHLDENSAANAQGEAAASSKKSKKSGKKKSSPKVKWNTSTENLDFKEESEKSADAVSEDVSELASFAARAAADFGIFSEDAAEVPAVAVQAAPLRESEPHAVDEQISLGEALAEQEAELAAESAGDEIEQGDDLDLALSAAAEAESAAESDEDSVEESTEAAQEFSEEEMLMAAAVSEGEAESEADAAAAQIEEGPEMSAEERALMESELGPEQVEFIEADQMVSIIESMLFSTDKPVSVATLKVIFKGTNIRTKDITRALDDLARDYAGARRGVTIEEINGGYQLRTKSDNAEYLRRLAKVRPFRLSGPALEVMAIVAYKQPITKHEIDEIRGVESGHLLRALMERGLVAFGERSELPGKPMTYNSTRKFLETFGLRNIRELPSLSEIDALLPEGIGEAEEEKETLSDLTDKMSTELTSSYSEGEDELLKINEQLQAVDTTSEFFEQEKVRERERRDRERAQDIRERLVVGEQVEEKDRRWLDRYEAKLHQAEVAATAAAAAGVALVTTEGVEAPPNVSGELEALSDEAAGATANAEATAGEDEELHADDLLFSDDAESDDLAARADWDEEHEGEV